MEQTRNVRLPLIGQVQHGEQVPTPSGGKRAKELGYFIAKIRDSYMQKFLLKFNEQYKGKQYLEIRFASEEPLTVKYSRCNQGGEVCYCLEGNDKARQKVKNGWKEIQCDERCEYRQSMENSQPACKRIGWLKFYIPSINKDRIWIMKITSQTSINNLQEFISSQKYQEKSLNNDYVLFLTEKEQISRTGQTFNNFILDILKKEDFISEENNPQEIEKEKEQSTTDAKNVNKNVVKEQETVDKESTVKKQNEEQKSSPKDEKNKPKEVTKKETKAKSKKEQKLDEEEPKKDVDISEYYVLTGITKKTLTKDGKPKEYLVGQFCDSQDRLLDVFINPKDEDTILECDIGTILDLDIKDVSNKKFAMEIKLLDKMIKNIAA